MLSTGLLAYLASNNALWHWILTLLLWDQYYSSLPSPLPILHIKKQAREVKQVAQHHTAGKVDLTWVCGTPSLCSYPCHSKYVLGMSTVSTTGNVRNTASQFLPQIQRIRICILTRSQGDSLISLCVSELSWNLRKWVLFCFCMFYIVVFQLQRASISPEDLIKMKPL